MTLAMFLRVGSIELSVRRFRWTRSPDLIAFQVHTNEVHKKSRVKLEGVRIV